MVATTGTASASAMVVCACFGCFCVLVEACGRQPHLDVATAKL